MAPLAALTLLAGCFTPEAPEFIVESLDYATEYTSAEDIVLRPYEYEGLLCPDGSAATFYAVYRSGLTTPAPFVIAFHSGSFDFVLDPKPDSPLSGAHYAGEDRLSSGWANRRVFETLGLLEGDASEVSLGTLPAALADAGAFTVYPANCWGDLWHNEFGYERNSETEYLLREGRSLAWAMMAMASPDEATATHWREQLGMTEPPIAIDYSSVGLVGVGEGGRAIGELLRREQTVPSATGASSVLPPIRGIVTDSTADDLSVIVADYSRFPSMNEGLKRVFPDDYDASIAYYSLGHYTYERGVEGTLQVFWSSQDPSVPAETMAYFERVYNLSNYGGRFTLTDTGLRQHGYLNGNQQAARSAVGTLLGN